VQTEAGPWTSPFDTRGHYWTQRWYNAIRLVEPGHGLNGWYCNIAMPARFDGAVLSYVDLQLDVRAFARDGELVFEVWDEDEFEAARQRYGFDAALVSKCRKAFAELIALIEAKSFPFDS
jgi:protein associated with RNAse G/E